MGVSVFPAPSTSTSVPGASSKPPKFTYNNSYDLSSLTGLNNIDGTTTAMAYRRIDNSIYFVGSGNTNVYKFNTSTNTGSYVGNNVSWSGIKDITCAYDGTLYASNSLGSNTSVETPQYSTDAGVTWTYAQSASAGAYRGFMALVDDGAFPQVNGNAVFLCAGGTTIASGSDSPSWWLGATKQAGVIANITGNGTVSYAGGRAIFPLRDGDDVKTGSHFVWFGGSGYTGNVSYEVSRGSQYVTMRSALGSVRSTSTSRTLTWNISPTQHVAATSGVEPMFTINRPTTIDSRWIVGINSGGPNILEIIDYQTAATAGSVALPNFSLSTGWQQGSYAANPIYVSATKKLYVLQGNGNGTTNVTKMHVYDVTTY